jgi:hypothetical protein
MSVSLVIRKQKFTIKTGDEQLAMRLRRQVNDELQYSLLDVYNEVMNASEAGFDQDIYIDKITVNLGRCTEEEWTKKLPQLLKKKLEASMGGYEMKDSDAFTSDTYDREQESSVVTGQHNETTALIYYLEKGIYPWWFAGSATVTVKKPGEIIATMPDTTLESVLVKLVAGAYTETVIQRMRQRFVQAVSPEWYQRVMGLLISLQSDEHWKANMVLLCRPDTTKYLTSFTSVSDEVYSVQLITFLLQHIRAGEGGLKEFIQQLFEYADDIPSQPPTYAKGIPVHEQVKDIISQLAGEKPTTEIESQLAQEDISEKETGDATKDKQGKSSQKQTGKPEEAGFPAEGIYIDNGGLVILHPFLQPLFEEFGLIEANRFVSAQAQQRAAVLLYYLHQGIGEYEEYEMAFNKILCGLSLEDVLAAGIVLTGEEKKECDQLLDTVVGYWEALKGASGDALQETFLRRRAKLCFKDDYWLLQVERNATDILIDRLPWGFGIIKLPWLKQLIHVEW